MLTILTFLKSGLAASAAALAGTSFGPGVARAETKPGFLAAKDIAEAGQIFGLPIVLNYGTMCEVTVDTSSTQDKRPFKTVANEARVVTY